MIKKITAAALCLVMLFTVLCVGSSAQDEKLFYLVLGDSIGYGSGLKNSQDACFGRIVADTNGYDYANDAVPGHTTKNLLSRLENESVIEDVKKADIISISIGGNNFLLGNLPLLLFNLIVRGNTEQAENTVAAFYDDLGTIISKIRSVNPDAVILLQTLYNPQTGYIGEAYETAIGFLNEAILKFAGENPDGLYVVDVASRLDDSENDFAEDGIHPSAAGNLKIAVAVLEKLSELGLGESTEPVINTEGVDIEVPFILTFPLTLFGDMLHIISLIYSPLAGIIG
ncbi:MAG: hypothetical protein II702_09100 [Clostridia bacterium]|nr:hypothetical protein [Clostridia bacterium]